MPPNSQPPAAPEPAQPPPRNPDAVDAWLRRGCTLVVAGVAAAYASYVHQRDFARHGGADEASAALWPLSVDGLLLLATIGLLKPAQHATRRRWVLWPAFLLGIAVSLAANIAAAPSLAWQRVLVASWHSSPCSWPSNSSPNTQQRRPTPPHARPRSNTAGTDGRSTA